MTTILFLCVNNSCRSQMAEGLARYLFGSQVKVLSAGSEPTRIHPMAVASLAEIGIDLSDQAAKSVYDLQLDSVDWVITLCADEVCPIMPGSAQRLHWPLPDPSRNAVDLSEEELRAQFAVTREELRQRLLALDLSQGNNRCGSHHK